MTGTQKTMEVDGKKLHNEGQDKTKPNGKTIPVSGSGN
jgi:hypothetical protein